ncbi:MAG: heme exporter protein CcmB [Rhodospirillaceae bacterium]|nr:heme exporter protein CcmB [Rhodospirillaceae bacterium]|tara:strand:+ start:366 stop:1031 length:666 start_codon:yes stop_codon:yes gene_type:complete
MKAWWAVVRRDLTISGRRLSDAVAVVMFFVLAVVLFPLGVGPELEILQRIAPGIIWVAALLAAMLSLDQIFQSDADDGSLDLLVLAPIPLETIVLAKCCAHWMVTGLPLILAAPILGFLLNLPAIGHVVMLITLVVATPTISLVGSVGAALTVGARRGGVLVALLILPLLTPILIMSVSAVDLALVGLNYVPLVLLLLAFFLVSVVLCPLASAAALRLAVE